MMKDKNAMTSLEENSLSIAPEKVSPYDWEALGLKIYQENDSMEKHILTDINLMKSILDNIDKHDDGKMTEECLSRYKGNSLIRELLSKMIVAHRSEWPYSGSALDNVMAEYEKYYDSMIKKINPDGSREDEIQKEKEAELNRVRAKKDNLSCLSKMKLEGNSQLPNNSFYYFNPAAFVEQMQRINTVICNVLLTKDNYDKSKYGELLREINIRLAGFGGNVLTDEPLNLNYTLYLGPLSNE